MRLKSPQQFGNSLTTDSYIWHGLVSVRSFIRRAALVLFGENRFELLMQDVSLALCVALLFMKPSLFLRRGMSTSSCPKIYM